MAFKNINHKDVVSVTARPNDLFKEVTITTKNNEKVVITIDSILKENYPSINKNRDFLLFTKENAYWQHRILFAIKGRVEWRTINSQMNFDGYLPLNYIIAESVKSCLNSYINKFGEFYLEKDMSDQYTKENADNELVFDNEWVDINDCDKAGNFVPVSTFNSKERKAYYLVGNSLKTTFSDNPKSVDVNKHDINIAFVGKLFKHIKYIRGNKTNLDLTAKIVHELGKLSYFNELDDKKVTKLTTRQIALVINTHKDYVTYANNYYNADERLKKVFRSKKINSARTCWEINNVFLNLNDEEKIEFIEMLRNTSFHQKGSISDFIEKIKRKYTYKNIGISNNIDEINPKKEVKHINVQADINMKDYQCLTVNEVSSILRVNNDDIIRMIKRKELKGFKVAGDYRIRLLDLNKFMAI